ncbi:MAG: SDR family NAD(P)-dependent oxidoreductase [Vicinamibacterales bacterium]
MRAIEGRIALVTGATRGVGKGVALGLAEAGATVYLTGRTLEPGQHVLPGTLAETASAVTRLGGTAVALRCDHRVDAEVEGVVRRIERDAGRLDVLVNNVYASPDVRAAGVPFWELPLSYWDELQTVGLRSHYVASACAAPLMTRRQRGLIINISSSAAVEYSAMFGVAYGVMKHALDRLTSDMAKELAPHNVAVISLWPGPIKGEKILAQPDRVPPPVLDFIMKHGESPQFTGRAVAALAGDPGVMSKTGRAFKVAELALEYGFADPASTR